MPVRLAALSSSSARGAWGLDADASRPRRARIRPWRSRFGSTRWAPAAAGGRRRSSSCSTGRTTCGGPASSGSWSGSSPPAAPLPTASPSSGPTTASRPTRRRRRTRGRSPARSTSSRGAAGAAGSASARASAALALLHVHRLEPRAFAGLFLQSGSFFRRRTDPQESRFPRFSRIDRFVGSVLNAREADGRCRRRSPVRSTRRTTRATPRVAQALAAQGYPVDFHAARGGHDWPTWRRAVEAHLPALLRRVWR